jgi:hypothetical protein
VRALVVLVLVTVVAHRLDVRVAHADTRDAIERARELEAKLAYDEALAIIDAAIAAGQSDRDRLVELHLIAGRLNAGLDRAKPAEDHFTIVLALAPTTTLPDDTSPKIAVPFTVARTKTTPLDIKLVFTKTEVGVDANSPFVTGVHVRFRNAGSTDSQRLLTATRLPRPPGQVLEVTALDSFGNRLWSATPPDEQVPRVVGPSVTTEHPPIYARWTTWAVVTGVALAAGGIAAWRFDAAQNEFDRKREQGMTDFTDLQAIEDRGRRWGLAANIGFGVAAATSVVSIILLVRGDKTVVVTNGPGAGVGVAGRF